MQEKVSMSDGTEIFVRVFKNSKATGVPLILSDGLGCDGYVWKYLIPHFRKKHTVIHWNYRGHGRSSIPSDLNSIQVPKLVEDLNFLLDHLNVKNGLFCGHSMGVQVSLEAFAKIPERLAGLFLVCGGYQYPLETWHASLTQKGKSTFLNFAMKNLFHPMAKSTVNHPLVAQLCWQALVSNPLFHQAARFFETNPRLMEKEDFVPYFDHLKRMKAKVFAQAASSFVAHSAEPVLKSVNKPTLIVAGGKDTFSPPWLSFDMHKAIRKSELLYVPDGSHCTPLEHPELLNLRLEKFIQERIQVAS